MPLDGIFMNSVLKKLSNKRVISIISFCMPFVVSASFLAFLEAYFKADAISGIYYQVHTSDAMMQTLPIQTLRDAPFLSLWFLHIQPPMLDIIRAILANFSTYNSGQALLEYVDKGLYFVWLVIFALLNSLVFIWVKRLTNSVLFGSIAAVVWMLHPAPIEYATYLESTLLSSFSITWMIYELWRFLKNDGSYIRLSLAASLAFLTRTVLQWYFLPVFAVSLLIMRNRRRDGIVSVTIFGAIVILLCLKQFMLFHTLSTTTFGGYHKTGVVWYEPSKSIMQRYAKQISVQYPLEAVNYGDKFNSETTWRDNLIHSAIFADLLKTNFNKCIQGLIRSFRYNFSDYWSPSGCKTGNVITDNLPWSFLYNWVFSGTRFIVLLIISGLIWIYFSISSGKKNTAKVIGLLLVLSYIFVISNLCNRLLWTEAYRIKFFLEPVYFIFVFSQIILAVRALIYRLKPRLAQAATMNS